MAKSVGHVRRKPRYSLSLQAEVVTKGLEHRRVEKTANISESGLFLCSDLEVEIGQLVHLRIIFSDIDAYFDVKAAVVWTCDGAETHPLGFGVEFTDVTPAQAEVIKNYLSNYTNVVLR